MGVTGLLKDMIHLFGGVRFRHIVLFKVTETQFLLSACAETLETLQLYPTDPRGKRYYVRCMRFPANDPAAKSFLMDFDLSRIKSLRTLEFQVRSIVNRLKPLAPDDAALGFFRVVLSTIKSPAFFKVVVVYTDTDFRGVSTPPACRQNHHTR